MSRRQLMKKRILTGLMVGTVLSVVGYGTAVATNLVHTPLGDAENPNPSPSPMPAFTLVVHHGGSGSGLVTSSPAGVHCPLHCSGTFDAGTKVTLTAHASDASFFVGWDGACSGDGACRVTMSENRSVTATFGEETESLSVTKDGQGFVTSGRAGIHCPGHCSHHYAKGLTVRLFPHAARGWRFTRWSGACTGTRPCVVTMHSVHHVTAHFARTNGFHSNSHRH